MMARAKIAYILMIKVSKLFSFFLLWYFQEEVESMFTLLEVWENLEKLWKHLSVGLCLI